MLSFSNFGKRVDYFNTVKNTPPTFYICGSQFNVFNNVLHSAAQDRMQRLGLHWIRFKSKRSSQTVSMCLLCLRLRDKGEMEIEKKKARIGTGRPGCRESKRLFPQGKVICKGIVLKSVTKGRMQSQKDGGGGGRKKTCRRAIVTLAASPTLLPHPISCCLIKTH